MNGIRLDKTRKLVEGGLLILMGGVLPHAFMMPPRKTGTYSTSHFAKTGEYWHDGLDFGSVNNRQGTTDIFLIVMVIQSSSGLP